LSGVFPFFASADYRHKVCRLNKCVLFLFFLLHFFFSGPCSLIHRGPPPLRKSPFFPFLPRSFWSTVPSSLPSTMTSRSSVMPRVERRTFIKRETFRPASPPSLSPRNRGRFGLFSTGCAVSFGRICMRLGTGCSPFSPNQFLMSLIIFSFKAPPPSSE